MGAQGQSHVGVGGGFGEVEPRDTWRTEVGDLRRWRLRETGTESEAAVSAKGRGEMAAPRPWREKRESTLQTNFVSEE